MDKLQVPKEIADAVNACEGLHKAFLIREIGNVFYGTTASNLYAGKLANLLKVHYSLEEAVQICFGEYVVIKTPEEEITDIYNAKVGHLRKIHQEGVRQGIRYVAAAFNLKIRGVNYFETQITKGGECREG